MAKFIIVLCAFVACVAGHQSLVAPLGAAPLGYSAALTYSSPLAYASALGYSAQLAYATPVAYNLAPGGSSRIDIQNNFARQYASIPVGVAQGPVAVAAPLSVPAPLARIAAPISIPAPLAAAPLRYSSPVIAQFGGFAAPLAAAPLAKIAAAAPIAVPAPLSAAPVAVAAQAPLARISAPVVAPVPLAPAPYIPSPLAYNAPLNRYHSAVYSAPLSYAVPAGVPVAARYAAAPVAPYAASPVPLAAPVATTRLTAAPVDAPAAVDATPVSDDTEQVSAKLSEAPTPVDGLIATPAPVDGDSPAARNASDVTQSPVAPVRSN